MNKKGVEFYLPFLAVLSIALFTWTAYTISTSNIKDSDFQTGQTAKYLIQVYDEAEKAWFYLDESTKLASEEAFETICKNGGYNENADCKKEQLLSGAEYVIWNTCPSFNPEEQFKEQLKINLKKYLSKYKSFYTETRDGFTDSYSKLINNLETESIENGKVNFNELVYYIEQHKGSTYKLKPFSTFETKNLNSLTQTYNMIVTCKDQQECSAKIPNSKITQQGSKLYIQLENPGCNIQFIVDKSQPLQGKTTPFN